MSENATNEKNCRHGIDRSIVLCTDCDAAEGRFLERAELTKQINDLPEMLRQYVHDLEADADPAGDKMRIVCLEENMAGLTDEIDRQRAEIERLTRENEDFLDERQRRIDEILRLRAALDSLLTALNFRDSGERLFAVYGMPAIDAANAAAALLRDGCPPVETGNDPGVILKELWSVCRVVFYPDMGDLRGDYPIEHAPGAGKDSRALIEARLAERVLQRARTTQKASACPYGQSDCETTRGGVCQCAMPAEQASDGRD